LGIIGFDKRLRLSIRSCSTQNSQNRKKQDISDQVTPTLSTPMIFDLAQQAV
jgi:hypothetical protein